MIFYYNIKKIVSRYKFNFHIFTKLKLLLKNNEQNLSLYIEGSSQLQNSQFNNADGITQKTKALMPLILPVPDHHQPYIPCGVYQQSHKQLAQI